MESSGGGWFGLVTTEAKAGSRYKFQVDGGIKVPDPASRYQPQDVHGASEVIDPRGFSWSQADWKGRPWEEAAIYELHVGAFSASGLFSGVQERLDYLDRRLAELPLDPQAYWWYRDLRRFGTVPHAGFGLGLERTIIYATGMANIRDVIPFPRTPGHAAF